MAQVRHPHPNQLELDLFSDSAIDINEELETELNNEQIHTQDGSTKDQSSARNHQPTTPLISTETTDLLLPETYEDVLKEIGENRSRLPDLIVPVTKFEKQIIQVVADIRNSGFLLFLYGVSGVGKTTFISSLKFQAYIPVKEIVSINAGKLIKEENSGLKLKELIKRIKQESSNFFSENNQSNDKLCISIEYLESLEDEEENHVRAFFRDLNALLREYPILIIWPVINRKDLENMQDFAKSFSSTIFHSRIPIINFTGPPIDEYPKIAKNTIRFFNSGKSCYDFQLNDHDFERLKKDYQNKPEEKHLIRDYLKGIKSIWEERTDHISKIVQNIPQPTEVWFIFSYPEAEGVVARFAKQNPEIIDEMWNADYQSLYGYVSNNSQRKADWDSYRLTLALSGLLTTKIMYLPTNTLISCIFSYAQEAQIPLTQESLLSEDEYNAKEHWLRKSVARQTLQTTPLYLQLSGKISKSGKRKSGTVPTALENAKQAFEKLNEDVSTQRISDQRLNKAMCLVLQDVLKRHNNLSFSSEKFHPHLGNIRPDILINTGQKIICLEFCYTKNSAPGYLADYVLRKLNQYMKQLGENFGIPQNKPW